MNVSRDGYCISVPALIVNIQTARFRWPFEWRCGRKGGKKAKGRILHDQSALPASSFTGNK